MRTTAGRQIGNCPKCNAVIHEQHSSYWCPACGEMLPDDILAQLPQVVGTPADTPPQRAPAVPAASDVADTPPERAPPVPAASDADEKHIRNVWIAAAVSATFTLGVVIYTIAGGRDPTEIGINGGSLFDIVLLLASPLAWLSTAAFALSD